MKYSSLVLSSLVAMVTTCAALANEVTPADATAMIDKATAFIKANGTEKAFAAFQDPAGEFVKGELYIFAYDFAGVCLAHGQKPKLVGKSRMDVEDVNGKKYIQEMVTTAKEKSKGWVDYVFQNPENKKVEPKTTYVMRVEGKDMFIACGIYKK